MKDGSVPSGYAMIRINRWVMQDLVGQLLRLPADTVVDHIAEDYQSDCWQVTLKGKHLPVCQEGCAPVNVSYLIHSVYDDTPEGSRRRIVSIDVMAEEGGWQSSWVVDEKGRDR